MATTFYTLVFLTLATGQTTTIQTDITWQECLESASRWAHAAIERGVTPDRQEVKCLPQVTELAPSLSPYPRHERPSGEDLISDELKDQIDRFLERHLSPRAKPRGA